MYDIIWQFFKRSGSIEAYLYINNYQVLLNEERKKGDK